MPTRVHTPDKKPRANKPMYSQPMDISNATPGSHSAHFALSTTESFPLRDKTEQAHSATTHTTLKSRYTPRSSAGLASFLYPLIVDRCDLVK